MNSMRRTFFQINLRAFALTDVLIAMTLSSFLVILLATFIKDSVKFSTFVSRHQQIRAETFALVNNTLSSLIREATAIDYANTNEHQLSLYFDKYESEEQKITIQLEAYKSTEDTAQLKLITPEKEIYLNSKLTVVEGFDIEVPPNPATASSAERQRMRAHQPMVRVTIKTRHQHPDGQRGRSAYEFYEDPHVSYSSAYTLRNYSFSNLRG